MKYLKIKNDGVLDIRLVALMGGTTKANDRFKIGQFGTGLKYVMSYVFRNNIEFKIFLDGKEASVTTEKEIIGEDTFEIICINNQRTSITTKMGLEWDAWMIIRELWCNALDAGEAIRETVEETLGEAGKTIFYIQIDKEFQQVLDNWNNYFIQEQEPLSETEDYKIYPGGNALRIYKQGVLIYEDKNKPALFSYDVRTADINELREFRGTASREIVHALSSANKIAIQHFIENVTDDVYEGKMDYNWFRSFATQWRDVIGNAKIIHQEAVDKIQAREVEIDLTGTIVLPKPVYDFLSKQFKGIGALRVADKVNEFYEIHSEKLSEKLNEVFTILEACEYHIHPELKFLFGMFGDKGVFAKVNLDTKEVMISENILDHSIFKFVAVIIEENEHFKTSLPDCSRQFQQHWIDLYTKTLLSKNAITL